MSRPILFVVVLFVLVCASHAVAAPSQGRDPVFEQEIAAQLDSIEPDATPIFQRGTAALDAGDYASAADLFAKVLALAPGFSHAERRECGALSEIDRRDEALALCRSALARDASAQNQAALAAALLAKKGGAPPADIAEAKRLAMDAAHSKQEDPYYWMVAIQAELRDNDLPNARIASIQLERLAPDDGASNFFVAVTAAESGDFDHAEKALARARANGFPEKGTEALAKAIDDARADPLWLRVVKWLGWGLAVWFIVLGLLLGAGYALSRATLRAIAARPTEANVRANERRLRKTYRAILWCACAYYYASLPLLAIVVVAATAGVIVGILAAGFIAPKLFIILVIVAFGSLVAIAKSLFVKVRDEDPGLLLDLGENPKMRAALDEVAARIGTRPVDRVFVTPFTELAVFDRGSLGAQLRGSSDRCLIVGAGVLDGMRLRAFKSVLSHEYGHFHNEDTAGGGFALGVRRSLYAMAIHLVARRAAGPFNPAWWFVRGFRRAFLGISQGASRLQEVLADRWAAFAYGSTAFEEGLRHVIERSVRFDAHVGATLDEVVKEQRALPNLYAFTPATPAPSGEVDSAVTKALGEKPTPFDSHPCPDDRLRWVRELAFEGVEMAPGDEGEAWSLFADRTALEAAMTEEVRRLLKAKRGIALPAA